MRGPSLAGGCLVDGCPEPRDTHLGVCAAHWRLLPVVLKRSWWAAWHDDGRTAAWLKARRECLEHLARPGA